ncbi:electron transfer flavoprotein beta subunit [Schizosaccharomyces cryophilus OY26]|uniref:Probable electron transfer flavoprotein subunit beta n=1 Tax=Schizosaccharomyces cryophilus (strain OY26 / ATCC MYA-4695 / CBS 11777 / NBRC 106824 / NRRL Y48691) TaxID=653667 RepID=S9X7U8_SCHCR|nr:electron transfer flavoprotein beta subunit [Schizosaccharomyces cryophilus OY26]EPY53212.1 electron transfer flavoprotein beta subunit [Schizosaccharomyces cryophilus OY26]
MSKLRVLVGVKRTLDYMLKPRINPAKTAVDLTGQKMSINPFCDIAVEEAIRIKETQKDRVEDTLVVTAGPSASEQILRQSLAKGMQRASLIDVGNKELEPLSVAKLLKAMVEKEKSNLVILGKQAIDDDAHQTGGMLAAMLGWPQFTSASKVAFDGDKVVVTREIDGGAETLSSPLPAVITTDLRLNVPRFANLAKIMKARKAPLGKLTPEELGVPIENRLQTLSVEEPVSKRHNIMVKNVDEFVNTLKDLNAL